MVPYNFKPRDYQLEVFQALDGIAGRPDTRLKRAFLLWHRRAGKDLASLAYMFKEMASTKGIYYYFLPNYQQGRKIIWEGIDGDGNKFMDMMPGFKQAGKKDSFVTRVSNQEMLMETANGSIFRVIGTDNVDTIVGTNPRGCVFSEYSLQDPKAWEFIRPILAQNGGWAIFNGTPRGRNHMYEMDLKIRDSSNWFRSELQTLWADRPYYSGIMSPEKIQQERDEGMDDDLIAQEYGVSYSAGVKGAFYSDQIELARRQGRIGDHPPDTTMWVDTFWDLGKSDDTAIWFRQVKGGKIVFVDYYENNNKDLAYYIYILQQKGYRYRTHYLPWDGNHGTMQTQFSNKQILQLCAENAGVSADFVTTPKPKAVSDGINAVRARFGHYYFNQAFCMDGIKKLELYHKRWDSKRQVYTKEPVHDWCSHAADALRTEAMAEDSYEDEFYTNNKIKVLTDYDPLN